jgi:hypothetical protein
MSRTDPNDSAGRMGDDEQEVAEELRILFAMSPAEIAHDLEQAAQDPAPFQKEWLAHVRKTLSRAKLTPAEKCRGQHVEILLAHAFSCQQGVPVEQALYRVEFAFIGLQNLAFVLASEKGRLAEIQDRMDKISRREGLAADQYWPPGEGPADYEQARKELAELGAQVSDTFFASLLRRYHFFEFATLFEEDRMRFDVMHHVGERLSRKDLGMDLRKHRLKTLVEDHGPSAKELLRQMLQAHGLRLP